MKSCFRPLKALCFTVLVLCSVSSSINAKVYDWVNISKADIQPSISLKVENAFKLKMIYEARSSIDIATYDLRCGDSYSKAILSAVKSAARRGVKVRLITSWYLQFLYDNCGDYSAKEYLDYFPQAGNVEFFLFGGFDYEKLGLHWSDGVHEKMFIIDNKYAIVGGRGFAEQYNTWQDTGFFIKGPLVRQITQSFSDLIEDGVGKFPAYLPRHVWKNDAAPVDSYYGEQLWGYEKEEYANIEKWYNSQASVSDTRVRTVSNDLIKQFSQMSVYDRQGMSHPLDRINKIHDDIMDVTIGKIKHAKKIRMIILSLILNPKLKDALIEAKHNGADIEIITNVAFPSPFNTNPKAKDMLPKITNPFWSMGIPDTLDLTNAGIRIHRFQIAEEEPWKFLHRKLAIIDDTVFIGSHNYNIPSSFGNNETSWEIESAEIANEYYQKLWLPVIWYNSRLLTYEDAVKDQKSSGFFRFIFTPFMNMY